MAVLKTFDLIKHYRLKNLENSRISFTNRFLKIIKSDNWSIGKHWEVKVVDEKIH